jgi:radical SAM protein with 4Fe4S-binding SPASM domain
MISTKFLTLKKAIQLLFIEYKLYDMIKNIHIGSLIQKVLKEQKITVTNFANDMARNLFAYLKENNVCTLKIMGGEPTVHPNFLELYELSQSFFDNVALFTNALNGKILMIHPRKKDGITYNFVFINERFNFDKLLPALGDNFYRSFEIVIDSNTNIELLIAKIDFVYRECKKRNINRFQFQLTINCISNIFHDKKTYNENFRKVLSHIIKEYRNNLSFDHAVPFCFWEEESIGLMDDYKINYHKQKCTGKDFGLIDSNFNLLHCNQHPIILTSMLKNQRFISIKQTKRELEKSNKDKQKSNYNKICFACKYFPEQCNGGCMMHKNFVVNNSLSTAFSKIT